MQVWTFPPNWDDGILETLEWLTAVLASQTGVEQRIGRRQTPRRTFEASFLVQKRDRRYLDAFLSSVGTAPFYLPVWHDIAVTTAPVDAGANFIPLDTQFREFEAGGFAFVRGQHSLDYQLVQIESVAPDGLQLIANLGALIHKSTRVYPLVIARIPDEVQVTKGHDDFVRFTTRFGLAQANKFQAAQPVTFYREAAVLNTRPDESEDLTHTYLRLTAVLDNETGIPTVYDKAGYGFTTQQYRWGLKGRQASQEMRALFYYLSGKLKAVWLPTFMQDFKLLRIMNPGDTGMFVENIGYSRFNLRQQAGRQDIRIEIRDGRTYYARIIGGVEVDADMEAISVELDLFDPIRPEDVVSISFMTMCRLDNDTIEISHPTDAEGLTQSAVVLKSSPSIRKADPWTPLPYGDTVMNNVQALCDCLCSDYSVTDDYTLYRNPNPVPGQRHWVVTPRYTAGSGGEWAHAYASPGNTVFDPVGSISPDTFVGAILMTTNVPESGTSAQTSFYLWGTGNEGYTTVRLKFGSAPEVTFPLVWFPTAPGGPGNGVWQFQIPYPLFQVISGSYDVWVDGGIPEPYIPGPDLPAVGAGTEAWIRFYVNFPWVTAPQYTEASLRAMLAGFASRGQADARSIMNDVQLGAFADTEVAAMTPDPVSYSDLCSNPGMAFPGPLTTRLEPLKEAWIRALVANEFGRNYTMKDIAFAITPPATGDANLIAEFCMNTAPLIFEQWHRTPGHVSNFNGAMTNPTWIIQADALNWPSNGAFSYPVGQRAKATDYVRQILGRMAQAGANGHILRPKTGGMPIAMFEGHESYQVAIFLECQDDLFPTSGSYASNFWEEWTWLSGGVFISDEPWPATVSVQVSRVAPSTLVSTTEYEVYSRQIVGSTKYINYFFKVVSRFESNMFTANPFFNSFAVLPDFNKAYVVRVFRD